MSARRLVYTRKEAAKLLRRTLRTMLRWEQWGWLTRLPDAPGPEVLYDGPQVEALARRLRRLEEDGEETEGETGETEESEPERPRDRPSSRPKILPWRRDRPPRAFTPRNVKATPHADPNAPASAKPPPESPRSAPRPPAPAGLPPRSVAMPMTSHAPLPGDVEAEKWTREIDERKRAWEEERAAAARGRDEDPPSSASGRR